MFTDVQQPTEHLLLHLLHQAEQSNNVIDPAYIEHTAIQTYGHIGIGAGPRREAPVGRPPALIVVAGQPDAAVPRT